MGRLYVVPTPVGNLEDMTFRAIRILKEADLVLAEDTRTSGILLKHFEIKNAMQSYHKFNEHKTVEGIINRLKAGETIALVSDAGTPGISDPGFLVVRECVKNDIEVQCLPGATAFVPALVASGLPDETFLLRRLPAAEEGTDDAPERTDGRNTHDDFLRVALPAGENTDTVCRAVRPRTEGFRMPRNLQDTRRKCTGNLAGGGGTLHGQRAERGDRHRTGGKRRIIYKF